MSNFADGFKTANLLRTIQEADHTVLKRKPREGDLVLSLSSGNKWVVEKIHKTPGGGRVEFYEVVDRDNPGRQNTFKPGQIAVIKEKKA